MTKTETFRMLDIMLSIGQKSIINQPADDVAHQLVQTEQLDAACFDETIPFIIEWQNRHRRWRDASVRTHDDRLVECKRAMEHLLETYGIPITLGSLGAAMVDHVAPRNQAMNCQAIGNTLRNLAGLEW